MSVPNVWVRILIGLAGIPGIVAVAWAGGAPLFLFVTLIAMIGLREFYRMVQARDLNPVQILGFAAVFGLCLDAWRNGGRGILAILTLLTLLTVSIEIFRRNSRAPLSNTGVSLFGVVYTGGLLSYLILLGNLEQPGYREQRMGAVLLAFAIPWLCDTAAYFFGRWLGRRKLIPRVSAGKTVEGAAGGAIGAMIGLLALRPWLFPFLSPYECLIVGATGSGIAQIGDLAESLLKRDAGVKDSSRLLPGHGGVLDRFDSVLFVAPCVYYYLIIR